MKTVKDLFKKISLSASAFALFALVNQSAFAQSVKEQHDSVKVEEGRKNLGDNRREVLKDVGNGDGKEAKADYKKMRANEKETKANKKEWKAEKKRRKAAEVKADN